MQRWLLVRGVDGILVPDPWDNSDPRRFAGKQMLNLHDEAVQAKLADGDGHHHERFENVAQVIRDDALLRAEIKAGTLKLLGECVAKTHAKAVEALMPAMSASAPKQPNADIKESAQ